ncbi:MAG: DUF4381 domain-containing protein [Planctomycetota bacterium]
MKADPYSLDLLRDVVSPMRVSWWPPSPGSMFLVAIVLLWFSVLAFRLIQRYRRRAYRRQAVRELAEIKPGDFLALSELLKRVALVSFPRERVASLAGSDWMQFLSSTNDQVDFSAVAAERLAVASAVSGSANDEPDLWRHTCGVAKHWIVVHGGESEP